MKTKLTMRYAGFSFIDLLMIVAALAAMVFVLLPLIAKPRVHSCRISCTNHLKQIGLAYRQWATDNNDKFPAQVSTANGGAKEWIEAGTVYTSFLVMSNELNTPKLLICPQEKNTKRVAATLFTSAIPADASPSTVPYTGNSNLSYFVGLDADETQPDTILSGDDNFTVAGAKPAPGILMLWTNTPAAWTKDRHVNQGNIGFADGSVMGLITPMIKKTLVNTGVATNRLAMP